MLLSLLFEIFSIFAMVHFTECISRPRCMVGMTDHFSASKPVISVNEIWPQFCRTTSHASEGAESCEQRYAVPVVWHIIMDSKKNGYISDKVIKDEMIVLNDGFKNSTLHFHLRSIQRWTNDTWSEDCDGEIMQFMSVLSVEPALNLNIYTCKLLYADGYTQLPWMTMKEDSKYNGVVIKPDLLIGATTNSGVQGEYLIHEVGHHFGLLHYFGNMTCDKDADYVDDTPISSVATYDCPTADLTPDSCKQNEGSDPIHNYMGYASDTCLEEFTPGQIKRMSCILKVYKPTLMSVVHRPCSIDSVFRWSNDFIYFFSGESYYRYDEVSHSINDDYPRSIYEHWRGIPNNIDGVFRYSNGITYFFKGSYYYRFNDTSLQVDQDYPKKMSEFWKGIPNNIDDVISYSNGHTYFFKDNLYYRFNCSTASVDQGYPKPMSQYWIGIPEKIQGALTWFNGEVYFFKDAEFWVFTPSANDNTITAYNPKSIKIWWKDPQQFTGYSVFRHCNGYTYFLSGQQYWRLNDLKGSVDYTYPQPLSNWRDLPSKIDGMFVWSNGYMYVFSGELYYRFNQTSQTVCQGYPKEIASFWQGIPNNIDAVFRSNNGLTYFFKNSEYYRFNDIQHQVETGYPKPISTFWKGIPDNVDTVFRWSNGQTYFFKGNNYYRFNFTKGAVDDGFPRYVSEAWKGVLYSP